VLNIRKILFPTDFSDCSKHAFIHALRLAREHRSELHLLHVIVLYENDPENSTHAFPGASEIQEALEGLATDRMGEWVRDSASPDLVVHQAYRRDLSAAPAILGYALEEEIDLIVMGTHGRRRVRKLLLGSVAAEVTRLAPCSVMTVRGVGEEAPNETFRRILVPTDFSESGKGPLTIACDLASSYGAELQLIHVLSEAIYPAFYGMGAIRLGDLEGDILQATESSLEEMLAESTTCEGVPTGYFALEGHPGSEIVRFSRDQGSDLIVMATHGLTGIKHLLMGSTTEKVLASAECPVLIVKESGRSTPQ
jgi:nucleotide-binding universal stress UspA family protein